MAVETITITVPLQHLSEVHVPLFGKQEANKVGDDPILVADLPKFDVSSIRKICKIGSGYHSNVFLVTTPARQQLALKCLDSRNTIPSQELYDSLTSDLKSEACILAGLDHENIIKIRGLSCPSPLMEPICSDPSDDESDAVVSQPFFLMDVLSETLRDRIQRWSRDGSNFKRAGLSIFGKRFRKPLDPKKMNGRMETTAVGVARGMAYLHNKGIVVQDLKPENIGFDMNTGQPRIFDFGMARHVLDLSINKTVEICGTPRYMAPEIMSGETATKASDVYSFGCVLYTLCTLKVPFHDFVAREDEDELLEEFKAQVVSGQRPCLRCIPSPALRNLIEDCWAQDPFDRPTFEEIVEERLPAMMISPPVWTKRKFLKKSLSDINPFQNGMNVSVRSDSGFTRSVSVI